MDPEQNYTWIREARDALLASDLVEPPGWLRERAVQLFQTRSLRAGKALIERVRATLVFDSRRPGAAAAAGVRSGASKVTGPWQLLYRGGDVDSDLLVRPNQDGRTMSLRGQALSTVGDVIDAGTVEALPADTPRPSHGATPAGVRSELEPTGEFALANLERGRYDLLVRFGAREIELSDVGL